MDTVLPPGWFYYYVIPAQAGIHLSTYLIVLKWIPAFAGMTLKAHLAA